MIAVIDTVTNTQKKASYSWFLALLTTWSKSSYEFKSHSSVLSLREIAKYLTFSASIAIDSLPHSNTPKWRIPQI